MKKVKTMSKNKPKKMTSSLVEEMSNGRGQVAKQKDGQKKMVPARGKGK